MDFPKVMEALESHFDWMEYFQPRLHAVSLFFSNRGRCMRFANFCILRNKSIKDSYCFQYNQ